MRTESKVEKFKSELTKRGFADFVTIPFETELTSIQVVTSEENIQKLAKLCKEVELHFKRSN